MCGIGPGGAATGAGGDVIGVAPPPSLELAPSHWGCAVVTGAAAIGAAVIGEVTQAATSSGRARRR